MRQSRSKFWHVSAVRSIGLIHLAFQVAQWSDALAPVLLATLDSILARAEADGKLHRTITGAGAALAFGRAPEPVVAPPPVQSVPATAQRVPLDPCVFSRPFDRP